MGLGTKNVLTKLNLKEPITFNMVMSSPWKIVLVGKEENSIL